MSGSDKKGTAKGRKNWAGRKAMQRAHPKEPGQKCARCGTTTGLQRDHKDGNTSNNAPGNFQWLCQKCMAKKDKNRWGHKGEGK